MRVVRNEPGQLLLQNGDFEQLHDGKLAAWRPAPQGFALAESAGRQGSCALACSNASGEGWFGASQTVTLNRAQPVPLVVRGWSKAEQVSGGADTGYSLYVDLTYTDGTPLWGQTANFRTGTHDWQERQFMIFPEKPVQALTLNCLFRGHAGQVWFDDVSVEEVHSGTDTFLFQGAAVRTLATPNVGGLASTRTVASSDGLRLTLAEQALVSMQVGAREFRDARLSGFLVRDVGKDTDFFSFQQGACAELKLTLDTKAVARSNHIALEGRIRDHTTSDRAVTLVFAVPIEAHGWTWGDDLRRTRPISGSGEYANQVSVHCGATGTQSLFPLAAVWDRETGLALGLDMESPAIYRVGYHAGLQRLFIAFDLGLTPVTERFPSSADFRFVLFHFDPSAGFRSAWAKYMEIFPDHFTVRSKEQGLWMPFTDVSRVQGWEDFGFRYHEGNNNVPWDDEHGVLSFRYTEPMTWWMPMAKEIPRTLDEALRVRDELARSPSGNRQRMALISRLAAMHNEAGEPALLFRNEPWANGAVWSLNPNPWLGVKEPATEPTLNAATVYWNESIKERLYGPSARGRLDGEYLDSLEGYVTTELNFRREHFAATTVPLTFSTETGQLALFKGLAVFEFTRWLAEDVHRMGKLMFANGVPYRFAYLCPWLDVLGTETDWLRSGQYRPASLATMDLWRALSGGKPYLLLMNTDYDQFTPDRVERYFQRALFYGMWPGFFSHNAAENPYWQNPRWYERDRPLFKKYIPLVKRVAEAGWQPLTRASCPNPNLLIERFGPAPDGTIYLTLFNDTAEVQTGTVRIDSAALGLPQGASPQALLGPTPKASGPAWHLELAPQAAALWELGAR